MNKLLQTLNNTSGRFTTLVVNFGNKNKLFCAQITSASNKQVSFYDVNTGLDRRVKPQKILAAKSGRAHYSRLAR
jgi:hypothetical protein